IIIYALELLPGGNIMGKFPRRIPENETIARVEAPRGELIHYLKTNEAEKTERYKIRSPTLGNLPALCQMLVEGYIADIPIVLAGIDPCFACMDRVAFIDVNKDEKWVWSFQDLRRHTSKWYQKK
ncbi:MAG: NADH dehydrogenase subunit, partial [Candidatus Hodarchaeota archaeon]